MRDGRQTHVDRYAECPACSSLDVSMTAYHFQAEPVCFCWFCENRFTAYSGQTVVWMWEGGDDCPDEMSGEACEDADIR